MTEHRYRLRALLGDYVRAAIGCALGGTALLSLELSQAMAAILAAATAAFAAFGLRTLARQRSVIRADESGISTSGWRRVSLPWNALDRLKLSYYSTRRDRQGGWMQLTLRAAGRTLRLDSTIDGFDALVARAAAVADTRALALSPATLDNLAALGIVASAERATP